MPQCLGPACGDPSHPPLSRLPLTCLHPHSSTLWDSQRSPWCDSSSDTRSCIVSSPAHLSRPPRAPSPLDYFHSSCKMQPRRLLTEKHVLTQHGTCHTRTTVHMSALKTRLCLPWGQGWSPSSLITQSLERWWSMAGTHMCLSNEWIHAHCLESLKSAAALVYLCGVLLSQRVVLWYTVLIFFVTQHPVHHRSI